MQNFVDRDNSFFQSELEHESTSADSSPAKRHTGKLRVTNPSGEWDDSEAPTWPGQAGPGERPSPTFAEPGTPPERGQSHSSARSAQGPPSYDERVPFSLRDSQDDIHHENIGFEFDPAPDPPVVEMRERSGPSPFAPVPRRHVKDQAMGGTQEVDDDDDVVELAHVEHAMEE